MMIRDGHSLSEIVVVVLILGVMACVAVPRLQWGAVDGANADGGQKDDVFERVGERRVGLHGVAAELDHYGLASEALNIGQRLDERGGLADGVFHDSSPALNGGQHSNTDSPGS